MRSVNLQSSSRGTKSAKSILLDRVKPVRLGAEMDDLYARAKAQESSRAMSLELTPPVSTFVVVYYGGPTSDLLALSGGGGNGEEETYGGGSGGGEGAHLSGLSNSLSGGGSGGGGGGGDGGDNGAGGGGALARPVGHTYHLNIHKTKSR